MSSNYCNFTVQATRCCPDIIAFAHTLYYHSHSLYAETVKSMMHDLDERMAELNQAYADAKEKYQKDTSGAPAESSALTKA